MKLLTIILFSLPAIYLLVSYSYLAIWHKKIWLFPVVTHEDGRHTLWGEIAYWAHFMACLPTALFIALCIAGGALSTTTVLQYPYYAGYGVIFLIPGLVFVALALLGSIKQSGFKMTMHYALQKFERDHVSSWGGCWNQFVPSNIVIGLGSVAAGMIIGGSIHIPEINGGIAPVKSLQSNLILGLAVVFFILLCVLFKTGKRSFTEPRWLAHSIREIATYPLTAVPAGLGTILLTIYLSTPKASFSAKASIVSIFLIAAAFLLFAVQLMVLHGKNVVGMSQKPSYAPNGLSISYLLASHVFEHVTDIVFIAITAPGFYLLGLGILMN